MQCGLCDKSKVKYRAKFADSPNSVPICEECHTDVQHQNRIVICIFLTTGLVLALWTWWTE